MAVIQEFLFAPKEILYALYNSTKKLEKVQLVEAGI